MGLCNNPNIFVKKRLKKKSIDLEFADVEILEKLKKRKTVSTPITTPKFIIDPEKIDKD